MKWTAYLIIEINMITREIIRAAIVQVVIQPVHPAHKILVLEKFESEDINIAASSAAHWCKSRAPGIFELLSNDHRMYIYNWLKGGDS